MKSNVAQGRASPKVFNTTFKHTSNCRGALVGGLQISKF